MDEWGRVLEPNDQMRRGKMETRKVQEGTTKIKDHLRDQSYENLIKIKAF